MSFNGAKESVPAAATMLVHYLLGLSGEYSQCKSLHILAELAMTKQGFVNVLLIIYFRPGLIRAHPWSCNLFKTEEETRRRGHAVLGFANTYSVQLSRPSPVARVG
jgi:hypothetical protein